MVPVIDFFQGIAISFNTNSKLINKRPKILNLKYFYAFSDGKVPFLYFLILLEQP